MPALIEPEDDRKIFAAKVLGIKYLDQAELLPVEVLDYIEAHPKANKADLIAKGLINETVLYYIKTR